jgi:hypothetical protein
LPENNRIIMFHFLNIMLNFFYINKYM